MLMSAFRLVLAILLTGTWVLCIKTWLALILYGVYCLIEPWCLCKVSIIKFNYGNSIIYFIERIFCADSIMWILSYGFQQCTCVFVCTDFILRYTDFIMRSIVRSIAYSIVGSIMRSIVQSIMHSILHSIVHFIVSSIVRFYCAPYHTFY